MTRYTFELDNHVSKIEMQEFDDTAQIFVNGELIADYNFAGAGCSFIHQADTRGLIDTLVGVLYDKAEVKVEENVQEGFPAYKVWAANKDLPEASKKV